jgi:antitoxin HicB
MRTKVAKNLSYYMELPYATVLRRDEDGDFVATVQELPGCVAHGETEAEALESIKEMQGLWFEECLASGQLIPEPETEEELPSGKWLQRAPRSLHRRLVQVAQREGVSLNQLVTAMLTEAVVSRTWMKDRTEPEDCKACPLNRPDLWDRAFESGQSWRFETGSPRLSADTARRMGVWFEQSRSDNADETEEAPEIVECTRH